jgi:predicted naringenin-chalcone synthase
MKIARRQLVAELESVGYSYSRETQRQKMYRRGTHHVFVRKSQVMSERSARGILAQAGLSRAEIDVFIESCQQEES